MAAIWIKNEAENGKISDPFLEISLSFLSPSTHHICASAKNLGQTGQKNIGIGKHVHVDEIAYSFVDGDQEIVFIGQGTKSKKVGGAE